MNVIEILDETAARFPEATAIVWGAAGAERTVSFRALNASSRRLASLFRANGLAAGDAVVIFLPMSAALYEVMAAVLRLGMTAVFVEPSAWRRTLEQALARLPVRAFVGTPAACALRWITPALRRIPKALVYGHALPGAGSLLASAQWPPLERAEDCDAEASALVTFTSGTTGEPKGVLRSHRMLMATHAILSRHLDIQAGQVHLTVLPFLAFAHLGSGATSVIPALPLRRLAALDAGSVLAQMRRWHVTGIAASPWLMERLADACGRQDAPLATLRSAFAGGAPVWAHVLDKIAAMAPRAKVASLYGATEAEPIALAAHGEYGASERSAMRAGGGVLAGQPIDEIAVRILAAPPGARQRGDMPFSRATEGEIAVSGPHVSRSYLDPARNTDRKLSLNGVVWHRTGDAGYLDESARLWLVGRSSGKAADAGVDPLRVEAALSDVPGIARATLVERAGRLVLVYQRARGARRLEAAEIASQVPWCHADEVAEVQAIPMDTRHHAKVNIPRLETMLDRGACISRVPCVLREEHGL